MMRFKIDRIFRKIQTFKYDKINIRIWKYSMCSSGYGNRDMNDP